MYTQIFFVTSVRGMVLPPQIAANAGLNVFGAKIPTPFFFMSAAFFFPVADCAFLPAFFFSAFSVAFVAFVMVVFGGLRSNRLGRRRHRDRRVDGSAHTP